MAKPSNTVATAMDELGISITNSDGSFKSLAEMVNLMRTSFSGLTDEQKAYYATALAGVINTVKTAFAALNVTMLAYPIVLIIAAIAALVVTYIYLWNTSGDFRQFWIDLWNNIKEVAIAVWNTIKEFFVAVWEDIKSIFTTVVTL